MDKPTSKHGAKAKHDALEAANPGSAWRFRRLSSAEPNQIIPKSAWSSVPSDRCRLSSTPDGKEEDRLVRVPGRLHPGSTHNLAAVEILYRQHRRGGRGLVTTKSGVRLIEVDHTLTQGMSGGPVVDAQDGVIGIIHKGGPGQGRDFAIHIQVLNDWLKEEAAASGSGGAAPS